MRTDRATTIFQNGVLWTGLMVRETRRPSPSTGGRITAVGADDDVLALRGPDTDVVDLAGQTLIPGFVDAHAHIWKIGHLLTTLLDVRGADQPRRRGGAAARARRTVSAGDLAAGARLQRGPLLRRSRRPRARTSTPP